MTIISLIFDGFRVNSWGIVAAATVIIAGSLWGALCILVGAGRIGRPSRYVVTSNASVVALLVVAGWIRVASTQAQVDHMLARMLLIGSAAIVIGRARTDLSGRSHMFGMPEFSLPPVPDCEYRHEGFELSEQRGLFFIERTLRGSWKRLGYGARLDARYIVPYLPILIRYAWHRAYNRIKRPYVCAIGLDDQFGDYGALFSYTIPVPPLAARFMTDEGFGSFRTAGPVVFNLQGVDATHSVVGGLAQALPNLSTRSMKHLLDYRIDGTNVRTLVEHRKIYFERRFTLESAIRASTQTSPDEQVPHFIRDITDEYFSWFDRLQGLHYRSRPISKYLPCPTVVFGPSSSANSTTSGSLIPIAIRLHPSERDLVFPSDGSKWDIAKVYAQIAAHNEHYIAEHLGRHHFLMEVVAAIVYQHLHRNHPLYLLLEPHLNFTIPSNKGAINRLNGRPKAYVRTFSGDAELNRQIASERLQSLTYQLLNPSSFFSHQHLDALDTPFRRDCQQYWDIISEFVSSYVEHAYAGHEPNDPQLRNLLKELHTHPAFREAPTAREVDLKSVSELLSTILFLAGPSHAASHYPKLDHFAIVPAFPGAAYQDFRDFFSSSEPSPPVSGLASPNRSMSGARDESVKIPDADDRTQGSRPTTAAKPPITHGATARHIADTCDTVPDPEPMNFMARLLPPYRNSLSQFNISHLADHHFERFGDYSGYRLGYVNGAIGASRIRFQSRLRLLEQSIIDENREPEYPYLRPSRVPNSTNI